MSAHRLGGLFSEKGEGGVEPKGLWREHKLFKPVQRGQSMPAHKSLVRPSVEFCGVESSGIAVERIFEVTLDPAGRLSVGSVWVHVVLVSSLVELCFGQ